MIPGVHRAASAPRFAAERQSLGCSSKTRLTATTILTRIFLAIIGFALVAAGVLYGVLGLWGADRGSPDAWILALLGLLGAAIGAGLLLWAGRRQRRAGP